MCLHDNSKRNESRNMKFKCIVVHVYENSWDKFDIGLWRTKVKVTAKLSPFTEHKAARPIIPCNKTE